jgi:8-oxo-dGTP pyrophosphatase MutT (NUDIX family)
VLVKAHALIWHRDRVVIHQERRQGTPRLTLPGGRVLDRERLEVALRREVEEELGLRVIVGRLLYVAEVVQGHAVHDLSLVFAADALSPPSPETLLVEPSAASAAVLPPILEQVAADGPSGPPAPRWLGNVWRSLD